MVPVSQRSGARIEPLISLQWFMRMDELAKPAIAVVKDGKIKLHPERFKKVYLDWMENIRPWCVSRQLWWGHQIPVWYRDEETHVGTTPPEGDGWTRRSRPQSSRPSTRRTRWSPAATSSSTGSPAW
jgi:valyl-tRNA synthetase